MAMSPVMMSSRASERAYLGSLNERFQQYLNRVRSMREQSKHIENNTFLAHTQALENEIFDLKNIYEKELDNCRYQLDCTTAERNQAQLDANKNGNLAAEFKEKYETELNNRKKLENAIADAHRLLSEKDSLIQELRITIAQHQNAHLDTSKERDQLADSLAATQNYLDTESKARADLEATVLKLSGQIDFERDVHEKECMEMKNKIMAAERAIAIADEKLKEHDIVDDNLHNMIAKMRLQTQSEFKRFQDESESAYQASLQTIKKQLENESKNLSAALEENIHLKAVIEEMNAKIGKLDGRCNSLEDQNRSLIHTLEVERQQAANAISQLESKLREMQENLNTKIRELNIAYNASIPLDLEIDAFAAMLDAEEKRLATALANPPSELVQSARGDLLSSRHYTGIRSVPSSPRRPITGIGSGSVTQLPLSRPKSTPTVMDEAPIPLSSGKAMGSPSSGKPMGSPLSGKPMGSPSRYSYLPYLGDTSSSHAGNVRLLEVNPLGKYVRIYNVSTYQNEDISGFIIQQNVNGKPVLIFRFPPKTMLDAGTTSTVWAQSSLMKHNPPIDFFWKSQSKWESGPSCTTILCKPDGQAVSWLTGRTCTDTKIERSNIKVTVADDALCKNNQRISGAKTKSSMPIRKSLLCSSAPLRQAKSAPSILIGHNYGRPAMRPLMRSYGWIH